MATGMEALKQRQEVDAKIIERAWVDGMFRHRLLSNPKAAIEDAFGPVIGDGVEIQVLEESVGKFFIVLPLDRATSARTPLSETELQAVAGGVDVLTVNPVALPKAQWYSWTKGELR